MDDSKPQRRFFPFLACFSSFFCPGLVDPFQNRPTPFVRLFVSIPLQPQMVPIYLTYIEKLAHERWFYSHGFHTLRATSHTRLKAHDHCNLRALIGRKGRDHPSSLHTRRWRSKGPKKTSWMKSLHGVLHGGLWIRFHGLPEFTSGLPPRGGPDANSGRPWIFLSFFFSPVGRADSRADFKADFRIETM